MSVTLHPALNGARACIFDAGGTIVHPDWMRLSRIAAEVSGRSFNSEEMARAFGEMLRAVGIEIQREGFVVPDEMKRPHWTFQRVYAALGLDETASAAVIERLNAAHAQRHIWCSPDPAASRILDNLKQQGLILAVISNTEDGRLTDSLDAAGISDRFDLLIDSHLVGCRKPDEAIFRLTLERLGIEAHEAAFVGDSYVHDALAARAFGLRGILLDPLGLHPESLCPRIKTLDELCFD
ncbi:MAG TPA: HAD-IA family hydrolase [Pyrinomonadaceae bacterium]|nr:HAD-IA family hydrolase [Pyrinomonadaceae bacterium]